MRFPVINTELRGHVFFIFDLDAKIPKFTYSKFEKGWQWTSTCIKQVIPKLSNTVILCYLALIASYVDFFSEINLILVKMIILKDFFCDLEQVLRLI